MLLGTLPGPPLSTVLSTTAAESVRVGARS
jgi:hypothetical protein